MGYVYVGIYIYIYRYCALMSISGDTFGRFLGLRKHGFGTLGANLKGLVVLDCLVFFLGHASVDIPKLRVLHANQMPLMA